MGKDPPLHYTFVPFLQVNLGLLPGGQVRIREISEIQDKGHLASRYVCMSFGYSNSNDTDVKNTP